MDYKNYPILPGPLKAQNIKTLHGANYFSGGPVVLLRLDLGAYDEVFTHQIPGFYEKLKAHLPSLADHYCSVGEKGGFFQRVRNGTLLGHVTEHVAIELQTLAGMDVAYGKTRSTASQGIYNVIFRFFDEEVGIYTAKAALNLVNALLAEKPFDVKKAVDALVFIREDRLLGPTTQAIVDGAKARAVPSIRLDEYNLVQLGTGRYHKRIRVTVTSDTSLIAVETADNKYLTFRMLRDTGIPVPETIRSDDPERIIRFQKTLRRPIVVKPCQGHLGEGVTLDPASPEDIGRAVEAALRFHDSVIAQSFIQGESYRLLVIDYQFAAAARLAPPSITGDGEQTIAGLIDGLNSDPDRGVGDKSKLTKVDIDETTEKILRNHGYTLQTVLPKNEGLALKISGSLRLGGSSVDVTDDVHPVNRLLAERACRALGLNAGGVDVVAPDIGRSILENGGALIEINAAPDFRMHLSPTRGESRDVVKPFLDMLFPDRSKAAVPIYSVTGTAGKTAAVKLLSHSLKTAGYTVGMTSSEGFFVDDERLAGDDATGHEFFAIALKDPTIDCAVFEVPVETIFDRGLGYEFADAGIVLNVRDEGKSFDEADELEDIAYAKSVVAEQVREEGFTILNADDSLVYEMMGRLYSHPVLFSLHAANEHVQKHVALGGHAAVLDGNRIIILNGREKIDLIRLDEIPAAGAETGGTEPGMLLAVAAALFFTGVSPDTIRRGFSAYHPAGGA